MFTKCLRADLEYKTLGLAYTTTCSEVISILLSKYRMRHRDPNLFYMTMEINLRKIGMYKYAIGTLVIGYRMSSIKINELLYNYSNGCDVMIIYIMFNKLYISQDSELYSYWIMKHVLRCYSRVIPEESPGKYRLNYLCLIIYSYFDLATILGLF